MDRLVAPGQLLGQRLDARYHLLRVLSEDASAEVYEADDERLERRVAVHVFDGDAAPDLAALGEQEPGGVLDAGEHDGRPYVVLPLADGPVGAATGPGDDEPTAQIATSPDHTAFLPVPLVPVAASAAASAEPAPAAATGDPRAWSRRALLGVIAVVALIVLLLGLSAARDGVDVPTESTVPVTVETPTTAAPTTTSPPTTQQPAQEHRGKGKGKKGED